MSLSELLLSSTSSTSPLPTTQLHSLLTGSLLFSFKSPNASNSTAAEQDSSSSLGYRKTMGYAETANGCGGVVMGMGGKEGRAGINVWGFQKVSRLTEGQCCRGADDMRPFRRSKFCKG